ncbi:MAG: peptide chain release factor N(5)-glutamine methyltransferase [Lactobacillus sp.]|jgi:release factor glutamine methyltransferase|nr:peptide chain release factor N(5)-glutamine methyltransferase [Lactobacillus sp.]
MAQETYYKVLAQAKQTLDQQGIAFDDLMYVFLQRQNWTQTDYLVQQQQIMPAAVQKQLKQDMAALLKQVPPQYIVHQAWFYGRPFYVDERVLIPQYDTENLVAWVLADYPENEPLRVLDIGTGSGVLAITLKLARPNWQVLATDISPAALTVAQKNAQALDARVDFRQGDLLAPVSGQRFDIIVSNPPYISQREKAVMDASVLAYEPHLALFAENDGLSFYQRFFKTVPPYLTFAGTFYLEFGFQQKAALKQLSTQFLPRVEVTFKQDLAGQDRLLRGKIISEESR